MLIEEVTRPDPEHPELRHDEGEHHHHHHHHDAEEEEESFPQLLYHEAQAAKSHEVKEQVIGSPAEVVLDAEVSVNEYLPGTEVKVFRNLPATVKVNKELPDAEVVVNEDLPGAEHLYEETGADYVDASAYAYHDQEKDHF